MKFHLIILCLFCLPGLPLEAGPRSSPRYSVTTEVLDSGGQRSTSVSYVNQANLGTETGTSSVSISAMVSKSGYIGQLYQVSGVKATASSTNVSEGMSLTLTATASLDDATFLVLPTNQVIWSVASGPIQQITSSGLATADRVFQNTPAVVQARCEQYTSQLTVTVVDVGLDDFGIYAGDGVPDAWQVQYFGLNNTNALRTADPDADGQDNFAEYLCGTAPLDPNSRFRLGIAVAAGYATLKQITFTPWLTNRVYHLEYSTNLATGLFTPITNAALVDLGASHAILDTNATARMKFYRIRTALPGF